MTGKRALAIFLAMLISGSAAASDAVSTLVARALGPTPTIEDAAGNVPHPASGGLRSAHRPKAPEPGGQFGM